MGLLEDRKATGTDRLAARQIQRPYEASYFVAGKLAGLPVHFLIDTGCTTNLMGKRIFDRLPPEVKKRREECNSCGIRADGMELPFFGIIRVAISLHNIRINEVFVISSIDEEAILGMPFLIANQCAMNFGRPILQLANQELVCTDQEGRRLERKATPAVEELVAQPGNRSYTRR